MHEIRGKLNERDYLLKTARRSKEENDWSEYRRARNSVTNSIRQSKANYNRSLFRENSSRPKQFWNQIKKCYPAKEWKINSRKVFNVNGNLTSDTNIIVRGFCTFFTDIGKSLQSSVNSMGNTVWKYHNMSQNKKNLKQAKSVFEFKEVYLQDLLKVLKELKTSKSAGYDNIPASLIKEGAEEIAAPPLHLINSNLRESVFPTSEKCAKVTPVYKSGKRSSMDNYSPISVLPVLSKVLEKIVHKQIYEFWKRTISFHRTNLDFDDHIQHSTQLHTFQTMSENIWIMVILAQFLLILRMPLTQSTTNAFYPSCPVMEELNWFESYLFDRKQFVSMENSS